MLRRLLVDFLFSLRSRATVRRDLVYRRIGKRALKLDLYFPRNPPAAPPLILCIHGGGWCSGDRNQCPNWMLANHGYAVAAIEYRLTNEATFPAQLEDCQAAVKWLRENAIRCGFDARRIGVWGHSSGGHLASLLGITGDVQAVCAISAPSDLILMHRNTADNPVSDPRAPGAIEALLGGPVDAHSEEARAASPIHFVSRQSAPFLLIHGARDRTVPLNQSELFAAALSAAGVEIQLKIFQHGRHSPGSLNRSRIVKGFFDRHLRS
ncbi:MAG TPA: alpha/beta hydrolase [Chthoniobacterales bacterium]